MMRIKALALVTCTVAAGLTIGTFAYSGGDGTQLSPYEISTAADLAELAEASLTDSFDGKYFVQTADIVLDESSCTLSIAGNSSLPFMGSYNGMNYEISGLKTVELEATADNGTVSTVSGLFLFAEDAEIINVDVTDAVLTATNVSGGIAAKISGETIIENCSFSGKAVMPEEKFMSCNIGSIAGSVGSNAKITECTSDFTMNVPSSPFIIFAGGIAGLNSGTIEECVSNVKFTAYSDNYSACFGGIAGENAGYIAGCVSNGEITGEITNNVALLYIGGIAGLNNSGTVERTLNKATLNSTGFSNYPGYIGGICGYNSNGAVTESANIGTIAGDISFAGGVTGINYATSGASSVSECLNSGEVSVLTGIIGGIVGGNLATDKAENVSEVSASMNTYELESGNAAIGLIRTDFIGVSSVKNLIVRNLSDTNATTMTDEEMVSASSIVVFKSNAWVYPQNGFLPSLAVVKNLEKKQVIATALDKENGKAAFTVYNPGDETAAVAVLAFYKDSRLTGTKLVNITAPTGYSVHTADTEFAADADKVNISVVSNTSAIKPLAEADSF